MEKYQIGKYEKGSLENTNWLGRIQLLNPTSINSDLVGKIFSDSKIEKDFPRYDWEMEEPNFENHRARKVPVEVLEPKIAYLVKALSAANVSTLLSCEGHNGENPYISLEHYDTVLTSSKPFAPFLSYIDEDVYHIIESSQKSTFYNIKNLEHISNEKFLEFHFDRNDPMCLQSIVDRLKSSIANPQ